jgi:hypothetical protein
MASQKKRDRTKKRNATETGKNNKTQKSKNQKKEKIPKLGQSFFFHMLYYVYKSKTLLHADCRVNR